MFHTQSMAQLTHRALRVVVAPATVVFGLTTLTLGLPSGQALAASPAQGANTACQYNGMLLVPKVDAVHTYGWGFVANFDHAASTTTVITCLAERYFGQTPAQTTYTVAQHCAVVNTASPPAIFGGGVARFNGNSTLSCTLPVPATYPELFWVRTLASLPNPSQGYSFLTAPNMSFTGQTTASCALTLTSNYAGFQFANSATTTCSNSSFTELGSKVRRESTTTQSGTHQIGATVFVPPATNNGKLAVPANFSFSIGAPGQPMMLDWFVIDPTPAKGG